MTDKQRNSIKRMNRKLAKVGVASRFRWLEKAEMSNAEASQWIRFLINYISECNEIIASGAAGAMGQI